MIGRTAGGGFAPDTVVSGSYNVFLGVSAGLFETGSNKLYIDSSSTSSPLIYGDFDADLLRINGDLQATGYLSLNLGTNQITANELALLNGKTSVATGSMDNNQLVTKGYVDENDDVGGGLTGSDLTDQLISKWDDSGSKLGDSLISEGSGIISINGRLGIGTVTPRGGLEVQSTGSHSLLLVNRTDGATGFMNAASLWGNFGTKTNHPLRLVVNSDWKVRFNTDGTLTMKDGGSYNGTWNNASSRALKENIEPIESFEAFETLEGLEPVKYNYKKYKNENHVGFIAEDIPDLVATNSRKNISTMDIVAVLTKVVKEQQKVIKNLSERVSHLEGQKQQLK